MTTQEAERAVLDRNIVGTTLEKIEGKIKKEFVPGRVLWVECLWHLKGISKEDRSEISARLRAEGWEVAWDDERPAITFWGIHVRVWNPKDFGGVSPFETPFQRFIRHFRAWARGENEQSAAHH